MALRGEILRGLEKKNQKFSIFPTSQNKNAKLKFLDTV
jgi:hypothetical protein